MASFKVGQRVRIVGITNPDWLKYDGREATVLSQLNPNPPTNSGMPAYRVSIDAGGEAWSQPQYLAPLAEPGTERDAAAERFLSNLRKLGREPVTLTEKELLRVSGGQPSGCAPIVGRGGK